MRYGVVNPVHVGVELLNQHERIIDRLVTTRIPFLTVNDSGKVNVSKMTQDDSAFRMNASSRKVFHKCLVGIIITEMERKGCVIRRGRGIGMKRIPAEVDLRLGAINTTNVNKNREGKERDNKKRSKIVYNSKNM